MKHRKFMTAAFALLCTLSLAGCSSTHAGQNSNETPAESQKENPDENQNESPDNSERTDALHEKESQTGNAETETSADGGETPLTLDDLLETALLGGSVADFQEGSFQVVPDQDEGQTLTAAAPGTEDHLESTTVFYDGDCLFQIVNIDPATGAVELETAASSDVKKSTSVYICGETLENGEIHASKVLIPRYQ